MFYVHGDICLNQEKIFLIDFKVTHTTQIIIFFSKFNISLFYPWSVSNKILNKSHVAVICGRKDNEVH